MMGAVSVLNLMSLGYKCAFIYQMESHVVKRSEKYTVCPGSLGPFYISTYFIKWVKTFLTYSICNRIDRIPIFRFVDPDSISDCNLDLIRSRFLSLLKEENVYPVF